MTVTCATNTYTVGGSVTGPCWLRSVLSLNAGAQTLPVAANGTFTFPTALASAAAMQSPYRRSLPHPRKRAPSATAAGP